MESPAMIKGDYRDGDSIVMMDDTTPKFGGDDAGDLPPEIYEDMKKNETFLYFSFMFLNGSVLWAYYSCLSAQNYYMEKYPKVNFAFLTVVVKAWPMFTGHLLQMMFNMEKKISQNVRVVLGYCVFMTMGVTIMILSTIDFGESNLGGYLVLLCFSIVGVADSLAETTSYALAALFPIEKFTNAVQIGNTCAGAVNVTLQTLIRLMVGGVKQSENSNSQAFYIFFSMLLVVCVVAMVMYRRVLAVPCVAYLVRRNAEMNALRTAEDMTVGQTVSNYLRVFRMISKPCFAQFLVFFVSLSVFPGFGISAIRGYDHVEPAYPQHFDEVQGKNVTEYPTSYQWYVSPGIIGAFSFGDLFGRIMCTPTIYKIFSMQLSFVLTLVRAGYIVLLLMGVCGTSLYIFGDLTSSKLTVVLVYEIIITFTVGLTSGLLSTVTMGKAPRMVPQEDREQAGLVMVLFLFLGIASGATFGLIISDNHWFGV